MFTRLLLIIILSYLIGGYFQLTSILTYIDTDKKPSKKSQWVPRVLFLLAIIMYFIGNTNGLIVDKEGFVKTIVLLTGLLFIAVELMVFVFKYAKTHAPKNRDNIDENNSEENNNEEDSENTGEVF